MEEKVQMMFTNGEVDEWLSADRDREQHRAGVFDDGGEGVEVRRVSYCAD